MSESEFDLLPQYIRAQVSLHDHLLRTHTLTECVNRLSRMNSHTHYDLRSLRDELFHEERPSLRPSSEWITLQPQESLFCRKQFPKKNDTKNEPKMEIPEFEKEPDESNLSSEQLCIICMEHTRKTLILDCRHTGLCIQCSRTLLLEPDGTHKDDPECPRCRAEIKRGIIKIF